MPVFFLQYSAVVGFHFVEPALAFTGKIIEFVAWWPGQ